MSAILSPVQISYLYVTDLSFHIEDSPADSMEVGVSVSYTRDEVKLEGGVASLEMRVAIEAGMHETASPDDVRLATSAVVRIGVTADVPGDENDEAFERFLAANAVSLAYSHARTAISSTSGLSPAGAFLIPGISPYAVVDEVEDGH